MNFLHYYPQLQRALEALGLSLLHSFWQGLLLMILLWALLRLVSHEKNNLRFALAFGTLTLLVLSFTVTLYYGWESLKPLAPVAQTFSDEVFISTEIPIYSNKAERSAWEVLEYKAYDTFYQLAENAFWMGICWLLGSFLFSLRLSLGLLQIKHLRQSQQILPEIWQQKAAALQQQMGMKHKIDFGTSNQVESPLTLGWLRPLILIPAPMLMSMPAAQLESILVHELAHIRRHDYLWNLLQSVAEVLFFYHPAYWYIASVLEQERELACDAITLRVTGRPQVYAQALLQVASLRTSLSPVSLSAKGKSGFAERIRRIVAPDHRKKSVHPLPFLMSFCLIGFLLFAFTQRDQNDDAFVSDDSLSASLDSLRIPDYVDYRYNIFDDKSLPEMLDYSSMNDENYIIGKAASEDEPVDVREYFNTSAIFLLDGVIVQDPEQIHMSDIRRYEVYHEPLPTALQNLSERSYSSVVRAFSQMPEKIRKSSHIRVGGQVFTSKNDMRIPLADVMVEVQSSGQKTTTNAQGRFSFPLVRKNDTILFYTPSYSKPTPVPVDGREYLGLYTHIPNSSKTAEKLLERLKDRVKPVEIRKSMGVLQKSSAPFDSSIYDVMKDIILIDPKTNTARIKPGVPASQNDPSTYYTIGDPEVLFTLDGVVTDPHTVDRKRVDGASFETQNVPDGYLIEIRAISKEAAEAARKESQKTIISGIVTDQKTGKPLPGTNILVKGTSQGTIADLSGRYQIEIPQGSGELVFAYTGYKTRTETVNHRKILEIAMLAESEQKELDRKKAILGRVTDVETGQAIPGAKVSIDGTTTGTITDDEGRYLLRLTENAKSLSFHAIGYQNKKAMINESEWLSIKLLSSEAAQMSNDQDSILFIIDDVVRDDIRALDDLEIKLELIKSLEVKKGELATQFMTPAQQKRYKRVINIKTKGLLLSPKQFSSFDNHLKIIVFPNPSNDIIKVNFKIPKAGFVKFEILDKQGYLLHAESHPHEAWEIQEVIIPSDNFPPNTYFLRVSCNGESVVRRVILK